jgi:conjugative transfer signal peptidase TraF
MPGLQDRVRNTPFAVLRRIGSLVVIVSVGTFQLCGLLGIRINTSPSLPVGLYLVTTEGNANLVEFCPAEPFAALSLVRGYRSPGVCQDGGAPLLKPIIANCGDLVEVSAPGIYVNGRLLANTAPLTKDTKGRPLKSWPFGHFEVAPGTVWVASSYDSRSFDSRYFGPVSIVAIRNRVKDLLTL